MAFGKDRDAATGTYEQATSGDRAGGPVSLIGGGMTITGNVTVDGGLRIEGRLEGNVNATQVVVLGPDAVVNGDITAKDAIIGGRVRGAVNTTGRLELHATCDVEGEITAPRFKMDEGGRVSGQVRIGAAAEKPGPRIARERPAEVSAGQ